MSINSLGPGSRALNVSLRAVFIQVDSHLEVSSDGSAFRTPASLPTRVVRPGSLSPGRSYTFSLTATDASGSVGYTGKAYRDKNGVTRSETRSTGREIPPAYCRQQQPGCGPQPKASHRTSTQRPYVDIAEFSFETNAAPVGGYVDSDLLKIFAGEDKVLLQTMAWTDDFDDLPMTYEFGFVHGWHEVLSVSR